MALLPSGDPAVAGSITHPATTAAAQKTNFTALRTFLSDLFGTDSSNKVAARAALGAASAGAVTTSGLTQSTARLLGRSTAAAGAIEEISVGAGLTLAAGVLTAPAYTLGTAQATTSGTSIDFTGIPSTAKQITVSLNAVSTNGTSPVQVQLGAGAPATTGYVANLTSLADTATAAITSVTTGFVIGDAGSTAPSVRTGIFVFTLVSANTWVCSAWVAHTGASRLYGVQGLIVLAGSLDRLRLTTVGGTDTFDAGSVNIMYA